MILWNPICAQKQLGQLRTLWEELLGALRLNTNTTNGTLESKWAASERSEHSWKQSEAERNYESTATCDEELVTIPPKSPEERGSLDVGRLWKANEAAGMPENKKLNMVPLCRQKMAEKLSNKVTVTLCRASESQYKSICWIVCIGSVNVLKDLASCCVERTVQHCSLLPVNTAERFTCSLKAMICRSPSKHRVSPSESKWIRVSPSESEWVQVSPSESKWIQVNPSESKWI